MSPTLPTNATHTAALNTLTARIRHFHEQKLPFRVYHGSTNSTRKSPRHRDNIVDISNLNHILEIRQHEDHHIAFVEPNVPMDMLVRETLKKDLLPPVVMEFPGITCGGGFAGTSGESSSFREGFFDQIVEVVEVVLGNGEVRVVGKGEELFGGLAGTLGTLGVVTMLGVRLRGAKGWVECRYERVGGVQRALGRFEEEKDGEVDFMDGMVFGEGGKGVVCLGKLVDNVPEGGEVKRFLGARDEWFYISAEKRLERDENWTEFIPVEDYLFRYDRGAFWMGKYTYGYFAVPFNWFTRWVLSRWTHTRVMYHALHQSGLADKYIVQDVAIPYRHAEEFMAYLEEKFAHYPVWICPLKLCGKGEDSSAYGGLLGQAQAQDDMMLNFGVWGPGPEDYADFVAWNKAFESKVQALGGRKWLYAHTYYTEEQFWRLYDKEKYDGLRRKYHAEHLASLYEKVRVQVKEPRKGEEQGWWVWFWALVWSVWPLAGLYGWVQCLVSEEYLMPKKGIWGLGKGGEEECRMEVVKKDV